MNSLPLIDLETADGLSVRIARKAPASPDMVLPFVDLTDALTELFSLFDVSDGRLIAAGHVSPDVEIAADRAQCRILSAGGASPFAGDPESVIENIATGKEIIYAANPNRVTGANFGLADMEMMARAVPEGILVADEQYFDFYGISARPLIDRLGNVAVVRPLTAGFGAGADESGFIIASPDRIQALKERLAWHRISPTLHKILSTTLSNRDALSMRLKSLGDESIRLAGAFTKIGIQTRISATDFILMRVADPDKVANFLATCHIGVDNLSAVPELAHYIRYRLQSVISNTALIKAFDRMPSEYYRVSGLDRRLVRLSRPDESARPTAGEKITRNERTGRPVIEAIAKAGKK